MVSNMLYEYITSNHIVILCIQRIVWFIPTSPCSLFITNCELALLGAAEEVKRGQGLLGMACFFGFHIPDLRSMALFLIFP